MAGRPQTLKPEHVDIARTVSANGGSIPTVARACGIPLSTVELWIRRAKAGNGSELDNAFLRAIQDGLHLAEIRAIQRVTESLEPRDAQWWLTHHPTTRDDWSDAAAERRTERRTMATVLEAVAAAGLTPEQEQTLLLQMQARGLGAERKEAEG